MLIIQGQLQPVADELKKFVAYYESSNNQKIEQLVIIGGLAQMKGIDKYFGDNLSLPAYIGESFIPNKFLPPELSSLKYINALGLAKLSYKKIDIDLLPGLLKEEAKNNPSKDFLPATEPDDTSEKSENKLKKIFTNKLFFVLLAIIVLGVLLFVFKDRFYAIFNPVNTSIVKQEEPVNTNSVLNLPIKNIEKEFTVGVPDDTTKKDFILGEYHYIELSQSGSGANYSYDELVDSLDVNAQGEILANLDKYFTNSDFEIIPYFLDTEIVKTNAPKEAYVAGQNLTVDFKYKFLVFPKQKLAALLKASSFNIDPNNWPDINYEVISNSIAADKVYFNLKAIVDN
jgi:hypothetical protein